MVWFEGVSIASSAARYLYKDRQGSVIASADSGGDVQATYAYDAYGNPNSWGGSRFRYTGQIASTLPLLSAMAITEPWRSL